MDNKLRWGVIGAGGIADRRTIPGLRKAKNAELIAVMDIDKGRLSVLSEKYAPVKAYADHRGLLDDPSIDAVYIATPVHEHCSQIMDAADRGKNILIEKPIGLNAREAYATAAYCSKKNVKLGVGLMMRFSALHQRMKEIIAARRLGVIVSARAQFSCWYPDMPGAWRQDPRLSGGGALIDLGVHSIDLIEYISGLRTIAVSAFAGTKTFSYRSDDSASLLLELSNGAYAVSESNFNVPDAAGIAPLEFYGTGGSIIAKGTLAQDDTGEALLFAADEKAGYDAAQTGTAVKAEPIHTEFGDLYAREIVSFSDSILNGTPLSVSGEDGVHLARVIDAAYRSAKTGKRIQLR